MLYIRMKNLRLDKDWTQTAVGKRLHITQRTYSYYENGKRAIPIEIFCAMADLYNVSIDYLVGRTDVKTPYPPPKAASIKKPLF